MNTTPDHTTTTLDTIVVEKDKLLTKLRDNRQTHLEIYNAACAGFWVQAQARLDDGKNEFTAALAKKQAEIAELFAKGQRIFDGEYADFGGAIKSMDRKPLQNFSPVCYGSWCLEFTKDWLPAFPVNYLEDYDRAINMLEFSVAEKVTLSSRDFDAYVRNNWKWKEEFATTNRGFVCSTTGSLFAHDASFLDSKVYAYAISGASAL